MTKLAGSGIISAGLLLLSSITYSQPDSTKLPAADTIASAAVPIQAINPSPKKGFVLAGAALLLGSAYILYNVRSR